MIRIVFLAVLAAFLNASFAQNCEAGFRLFDQQMLMAGPICIPENPARIIVLDMTILSTLLSVNVTPIAATSNAIQQFASSFTALAGAVADISNIGDGTNLEAILNMQPDLILGFSSQADVYDQLSAIAPTVLIANNGTHEWKNFTSAYADAVAKQSEFEAVLEIYNARTAELDFAVEDDPIISLLRVRPDRLTMYTTVSFPGTILEDSGLRQPESQTFTLEEALQLPSAPFLLNISLEELDQIDGDYVFVFQRSNEDGADENLQKLQESPLWDALNAVQNDRVFTTARSWSASGIHMAHFMLDGLFEVLVGESSLTPNPFLQETGSDASEEASTETYEEGFSAFEHLASKSYIPENPHLSLMLPNSFIDYLAYFGRWIHKHA